MKLSVIIVNWNSRELLRECLHSLRSSASNLPTEIIVVDAASFDGCGEMLSREFPEVLFEQCTTNLGFGASNNLAFSKASGNISLFLNPDTIVRPHAIDRMVELLRNRPEVGIVGPRLLNSDGTIQSTCVRALPTVVNQALDSDLLRKCLPKSSLWGTHAAFSSASPTEVQAISGACMLMWSDAFRSLGGFRTDFYMYGEDMDLCARVARRGMRIIHVPDALVVHFGGGSSSSQASHFSAVMLRVAGETYMRLNSGPLVAFLYRITQALSAMLRIAILSPALLTSTTRPQAVSSLRRWSAIFTWCIGFSSIPVQRRT